MSLLRTALARSYNTGIQASLRSSGRSPIPTAVTLQFRSYAAKSNKKDKKVEKNERVKVKDTESRQAAQSTDMLVPGSQRVLAGEEYTKAEGKMKALVEKYRKDVAGLETRASGRVTPALLAPVRVVLPGSGDGKGVRLEDIATVGVREGTTLLVTVFEEHTLKAVEQALYEAKLPAITPQRVDTRTIKIPIPKPTVEARNALYTTAQRSAEDIRTQIRRQHQASLKKGGYKKHAPELDELQKLTDRYIGELDKVLAEMKKATGAK